MGLNCFHNIIKFDTDIFKPKFNASKFLSDFVFEEYFLFP